MIDSLLEGLLDGLSEVDIKSGGGCLTVVVIAIVLIAVCAIFGSLIQPSKTKVAEKDGIITYKTENWITGETKYISEGEKK